MQSLFTPLAQSPMGTVVQAGTDKPYPKVVYDMDVDYTTDQITVRLYLGCDGDEMWTDDEMYIIQHADFENWLEKNDKLAYDDTHYVAAHDGEAVEMGEAVTVSYTEYLMVHSNPLDVIAYLKAKKVIPDYIIDQELIQNNTI